MARAWIGTSGWNYKHWWDGVFYERRLRQSEWLNFYASHFDTVEINNSFYRLPTETAFLNWRDQVPDDFVFAVKGSRYITHIKRLQDPIDSLDLLFSRALLLGPKLGPVLFQLPPRFNVDLARLEVFLNVLDEHGNGDKVRSVLEVRDESWLTPTVFRMLEKHGTALCFADWRETHVTGPVTADFVYVRRHSGAGKNGNYGKAALDRDLLMIEKCLAANLDVYQYFNNDWEGHALRNAQYVIRRLGMNRKRQNDAA